jgi:hypothetical protein
MPPSRISLRNANDHRHRHCSATGREKQYRREKPQKYLLIYNLQTYGSGVKLLDRRGYDFPGERFLISLAVAEAEPAVLAPDDFLPAPALKFQTKSIMIYGNSIYLSQG